jgi:hypothetical protein
MSSSFKSSSRRRSFSAREFQGLEDRQDVLLHRELPEHRGFLRQVADPEPSAAVHRELRDVAAAEEDLAPVRPEESNDHVERRRLPGSVGA